MARVKELVCEAVELAYNCESGSNERYAALTAWHTFRAEQVARYGKEVETLLLDIYDNIADRAGQYWELWQQLDMEFN